MAAKGGGAFHLLLATLRIWRRPGPRKLLRREEEAATRPEHKGDGADQSDPPPLQICSTPNRPIWAASTTCAPLRPNIGMRHARRELSRPRSATLARQHNAPGVGGLQRGEGFPEEVCQGKLGVPARTPAIRKFARTWERKAGIWTTTLVLQCVRSRYGRSIGRMQWDPKKTYHPKSDAPSLDLRAQKGDWMASRPDTHKRKSQDMTTMKQHGTPQTTSRSVMKSTRKVGTQLRRAGSARSAISTSAGCPASLVQIRGR